MMASSDLGTSAIGVFDAVTVVWCFLSTRGPPGGPVRVSVFFADGRDLLFSGRGGTGVDFLSSLLEPTSVLSLEAKPVCHSSRASITAPSELMT